MNVLSKYSECDAASRTIARVGKEICALLYNETHSPQRLSLSHCSIFKGAYALPRVLTLTQLHRFTLFRCHLEINCYSNVYCNATNRLTPPCLHGSKMSREEN